ncbi:TVP38/TMEM64 family protein [Tahibacter soli]|jgi:uncharacterized membrane protein YdjX (TVP38/TMEM64 family)|uniref:TVP38/TMEM64 family membrane protein n=1 Tax=Tahibacter soli TaxID=2983605 RepID=A0A9X4BIV0_9GAMM|nr:VTT domain-containing protein [Tahibacter soli]MDC8015660.1 VTT domain-containing protein [Tahibacter soli]
MKRLRSLLPLILLVGVGVALFFSGALDRFRPDALPQQEALLEIYVVEHPVLSRLIHVAVLTLAISTGIPGAVVLIFLGGMLFGIVWGTLLSSFAVTLGALILFFASRYAFGDHSHGEAPPALVERLRAGYAAHPVSYTFFLRLVPFFPFGAVTMALAWLRCPAWLFALATGVGGSLTTAIETTLGAGLVKNIAAHGEIGAKLLTDPHVLVPVLALAALSLAPIAIKRLRGRGGS